VPVPWAWPASAIIADRMRNATSRGMKPHSLTHWGIAGTAAWALPASPAPGAGRPGWFVLGVVMAGNVSAMCDIPAPLRNQGCP
jgi:hypothetical protein